jgi:hypothetical protein
VDENAFNHTEEEMKMNESSSLAAYPVSAKRILFINHDLHKTSKLVASFVHEVLVWSMDWFVV